MNARHSQWEQSLSLIRQAIADSDTVDVLLRKALQVISSLYETEGILWVGVDEAAPESCRAYATAQNWQTFGSRSFSQTDGVEESVASLTDWGGRQTGSPQSETVQAETVEPETVDRRSPSNLIRRFRPHALPLWLLRQREHPQVMQLETGDLIIPVIEGAEVLSHRIAHTEAIGHAAHESIHPKSSTGHSSLRFVFQFRRPPVFEQVPEMRSSEAERRASTSSSDTLPSSPSISGWASDELEALWSTCHILILACDALVWKRRLEQSQRHTSLLSRTSHLLNSTLPPDRVVRQILGELGQSIRCDRAILIDLRHESASVLSLWERPRHPLTPLSEDELTYSLWQDTIDLFLQGGASYIELILSEPDPEPLQHWLGTCGAGSALILPVFIREDFFGTITLLSYRHDRSYPLEELRMAGQGTEQMAIALAMIQSTRHPSAARDVAPAPAAPILQEQLRDDITDLLTREALEQELEQLSAASARAFQDPFSLILCDIDYFKLVNDTHGYEIGDRVLQRLSHCLKQQLRRGTPLYRYGGEEFAILLEETRLEEAKEVAERLRRSVRALSLRTTTGVLEITASFGVTQQHRDRDRHALDIMQRAEQALFIAKRQGRDRVELI